MRARLALAAIAGIVLGSHPSFAMHRQTPFLVNLSDYPGGFSTNPAPPQGEPVRDYFQSASDLKNNGSSGNEIFSYRLRQDVPDANVLRQITNFAGDSENPSTCELGDVAAFDSNADILGNGNRVRQIFLYYRTLNTFLQLTAGQADSTLPVIGHDCDAVAFQSTADLNRTGAPTGYSQIFLYQLAKQRLLQITNWAANSTHPYIAAAGDAVVFQSDVSGSQQIYVYDQETASLTQLTNGAGDSTNPVANGSGNFVAFQSTADLLGIGSTGSQIFYLDRERSSLRQITAGVGDSFKPSLSNLCETLSFISRADLLGTGATGQHLFIFQPASLHLYQATKQPGAVSDDPKSANNFVLFDTDEDIMALGMTGRQVYSLDTWGHIKKIALGKRIVPLQPQGQLDLTFGDRDGRAEGAVTLTAKDSTLPPTMVPEFGTFCFTVTANGFGTYDCRGGRPDGDLVMTQDHDTDEADFTCDAPGACREGDPCRLPLLSPHRKPCPACVNNSCTRGPYAGQLCFDDATCLLGETCENGGIGVCNGPVRTDHAATFQAGGVLLAVPVSISLSRAANRDNVWCTDDDEWVFKDLRATIDFTTGNVSATINDADDAAGASLVTSDTGTPFDCQRLEEGNFQSTAGTDSALVGELPLLDVPTTSGMLQDLILPVHLTAFGGNNYTPCTSLTCRILSYCTSDVDCDDGSVCNGQETCVNNTCASGTPLLCDDGNPCNGAEVCDPILGCQAGPPPTCDDGARCSADACDNITGQCVHTFIPGCCTTDADCRDTDVCNGAEHCLSGNCVAGTPLACSDGNACNGVETCDPQTGCVTGTAPNCNDGAACTIDGCDPGVGCVHTSVHGCCTSDADCRDNDVCNGQETCLNGDCVPGTPLTCDDGNVCNGTETCDPLSGCVPGTPPVCIDDGARCTADYCDPVNGCIHPSIHGCCAVDADCRDTNACNGLETCVAGDCVPGTPPVCNDNNVCNGTEACYPSFGCVPGTPLACGDDGARCTTDTCDATLGCIHTNIPGCCTTDADCQDTSVCNGLERCMAGNCISGTPLFCDDGDPCNGSEVCDDARGCVAGPTPDPYTLAGVRCTLDDLWRAFRTSSVGGLGGPRRYTILRNLLVRVRKNFLYPSPKDDGVKRYNRLKPLAAMKFLRVFNRRLTNGMHQGMVAPATGQPLIERADTGIQALLQYYENAPRPQ